MVRTSPFLSLPLPLKMISLIHMSSYGVHVVLCMHSRRYGGGPHFPRKMVRDGKRMIPDTNLVMRNGHYIRDEERTIIIFQFSRHETVKDIIEMVRIYDLLVCD